MDKLRHVLVSLAVVTVVLAADSRPRVIVSSDIGGTDPDDYQSMAHLRPNWHRDRSKAPKPSAAGVKRFCAISPRGCCGARTPSHDRPTPRSGGNPKHVTASAHGFSRVVAHSDRTKSVSSSTDFMGKFDRC